MLHETECCFTESLVNFNIHKFIKVEGRAWLDSSKKNKPPLKDLVAFPLDKGSWAIEGINGSRTAVSPRSGSGASIFGSASAPSGGLQPSKHFNSQ